MPKTDFDQLLHRYLTNQVSEVEKNKIEAWLTVKKTDKSIADILTPEEEDILFKKITSNIDNIDEIRAFRPSGESSPSNFFNRSFRIAASILLVITLSFFAWRFSAKDNTIEIASTSLSEKKILDDGSIVWLAKGSTLTYSENSTLQTRNVVLVGEGLFEVAKDPTKPFLITGGGVLAKVVGTSFSLKTNATGIELKVLTGIVNLSSDADKAGIDITPHQKIVYTYQGNHTAVPLDDSEVAAIISSTQYNMRFEDKPMSDVLARIKDKFEIAVDLSNSQVNKCRVTADFTDQSLDKTFKMLSALLEITYKINGKTVEVIGKGCN